MQRIEITGGYVELKDVVTRKIARTYSEILSEHARISPAGRESLTMKGINAASEYIVLEMISRIVMVTTDGDKTVEKEITPTREWLDELNEEDFDKLGKPLLAVINKNKEEAKK